MSEIIKIEQAEWLRRYRQQFINRGVDEKAADGVASCDTFEALSHYFEDDPEGAADMEMSYWDGE